MRPAIGFGRGNWLRFVIENRCAAGAMAFQHHRAVIVRTGVVPGAHLNLRNEANFCQENQ